MIEYQEFISDERLRTDTSDEPMDREYMAKQIQELQESLRSSYDNIMVLHKQDSSMRKKLQIQTMQQVEKSRSER